MDIFELEQEIRKLINSGRLQAEILADEASWNMLCSSLDLIGDTALALNSYLDLEDCKEPGECYLLVYGVLQTLQMQQEAARHIARALSIDFKLPKQLNSIRELRSAATGHPWYQMENNQARSCFISRYSLTVKEFDLVTVYSGGRKYKNEHIRIPEVLKIQETHLKSTLTSVLNELVSREKEHYKMHLASKLASNFGRSTSFCFQKVFEAILSENRFELGKNHLDMIIESMAAFKDEMEKRNEWGVNQEIEFQYNHAVYSSNELAKYFAGKADSRLNENDAYIFATFLQDCISSLKTQAGSVDREYEQRAEAEST